jgi:hypothetical protein
LLKAACRNYRERSGSDWLPSISQIRSSAVSLMRQASPADQDWNEAYAELQRKIMSVGYIGKPDFTNPALAETVRTLGEINGMAAKLMRDPAKVLELREEGWSFGRLAKHMDVSKSCIARICWGTRRGQFPAGFRRTRGG